MLRGVQKSSEQGGGGVKKPYSRSLLIVVLYLK